MLANIGPSQNTLAAVKLNGVPFIKRDRLFTHYYRHTAVQLVKKQAWNASVPNKLQYLVWTNQAMLIANSSGIEYIYHGQTVYSLFQSIHWQEIESQFCGSPFDQTSSTRQTPPFHPSISTSHSMISVLPMQRHHFSRIPHRTCWTPLWCDLIDGRIQAQVWKFLEEMINPSRSSHSSWKVRGITLETLGAATP